MTLQDGRTAQYPARGAYQCYQLARLYDFTWGNIIKYLWRWRSKDGLKDLLKAIDYAAAASQPPKPADEETSRAILETLTASPTLSQAERNAWQTILDAQTTQTADSVQAVRSALQQTADEETRIQEAEHAHPSGQESGR